jgi:hypothetical protein
MDVLASPDERVRTRTPKSCGPGIPTLMPSCAKPGFARRRGQESPVPEESTKDSVKTVAQGRPDVRPNLW